MKYQSELIKDIVDTRGHEKSSLHYESECIRAWIEETKGAYPKLCDYESEWLNYINENPIGKFPYETVRANPTATINNVVPHEYKSAILYGKSVTIDGTLQSVKMPVLTTTNEDGTKTIILSTPEDLELRGIGDIQDELDCLTGEVTERIKEVVLNGSENWQYRGGNTYYAYMINDFFDHQNANGISSRFTFIKGGASNSQSEESICSAATQTSLSLFTNNPQLSTLEQLKSYLASNPVVIQYQLATESIKTVDLSIQDHDGITLRKIKPIEGTMHITTSGTPINPTASLEVPVEAITQNLSSFIEEE